MQFHRTVPISPTRGLLLAIATTFAFGCSDSSSPTGTLTSPGPNANEPLPPEFVHPTGNAMLGQDVFRFETFDNEGFWTDAMQLPQGIAAAGLTPLQALQLGLSVNSDALNAATSNALLDALALVRAGADPATTVLGDPAVTLSLINQNAVIGVVTFDQAGNRKPLGNSGSLDLAAGDKVGLSCAVCHAVTDNSVLAPTPAFGTLGSVGREIDGPTPHGLDVGTILATADRTLAYFPMLQLQLDALGGATVGRPEFGGLAQNATEAPTEAEADAYLTGTDSQGNRFYPVGQFDAFPDGVGNPLHIAPFFRTDLSAPWGIDGGVAQLQDFNNTVYTVSLDPTSLLTQGGRQFLRAIAGPVGDEIADDYEQVLRDIGVIGAGQTATDVVPFVTAVSGLVPGAPESTVGRRVDEAALFDLNAYLDSLPIPEAPTVDTALAAMGRDLFQRVASDGGGGCTSCHQVEPTRFVPPFVIDIETMYRGYAPTILFDRALPLSDIQNSEGVSATLDDRLIVLDASRRGGIRGLALPLLLDLERRTSLLHDDSVAGATFAEAADSLMDPARGADAAHAFYIADPNDRAAVVEFLRSLDGN